MALQKKEQMEERFEWRQEPRNKMLGAEEEAGRSLWRWPRELTNGRGACPEPGWQRVSK